VDLVQLIETMYNYVISALEIENFDIFKE